MATEKRLIDANALIVEYDRVHIGPAGGARKLMEDAPTVDAVEVVRCEDCKRWKYDAKKLCGFCNALICYRPNYFWCMYGERRAEE